MSENERPAIKAGDWVRTRYVIEEVARDHDPLGYVAMVDGGTRFVEDVIEVRRADGTVWRREAR